VAAGAATHPQGRTPRLLVPAALLALVVVAVVVVVLSSSGSKTASSPASSRATSVNRRLPPYWTVRSGQTLSGIAERTGLSIDRLQQLNPSVDPYSLLPGQRLRLRFIASQPPRPKRLGPLFWTVRSGQSFGSIAAKTGKNIVALEHLNPRLDPTKLKPGDRVRLRGTSTQSGAHN
jgi:LysM repeat protein